MDPSCLRVRARQLHPDGRWGVLRVVLAVHNDPEQQIAELLAHVTDLGELERRFVEAVMARG